MSQTKKQSLSFYYTVVVWGDDYINMLLQVSLRCFLSENNIPGVSNLSTSKFIFVTTPRDYETISQSAIFKKLATYLEIVFVELDSKEENVYSRVTRGYELATILATEQQACVVYLLPDCIISDGTFLSLYKYAKEGRDVVLLPGPRVIKEKFLSLVQKLNLADSEPLSLSPRKLAKIGLSCLHDEFDNYNYTRKQFTKWPHMVTFDIPGEEGLLIRAFHLHPLMVNYTNRENPIFFNILDTIDAGFIQRNYKNLNAFVWEQDSDNMILYSMTSEKERHEAGLLWSKSEKTKAIRDMAQCSLVNELQKINFYNIYKLHVNDLNSNWLNIERDSFSMVKLVLTPASCINKRLCSYIKKGLIKCIPPQLKPFLRCVYWRFKEMLSIYKSKLFIS
ncbi:MAG: hypothetical protein A3E88_00255 [Legionellales bacterium RIFCSPHIGHO2_12_FULL_35_11]|nr:MAG: hypothetical protein A3E88_00255 [Legionellales bacterium RIFCSPHIGHO2_12_FULL_35_11]